MANATITLSMEFDMRDALRLARFELETGVELRQQLLRLVGEWEKENPLPADVSADPRHAVYFAYTPRGLGKTWMTRGLYDTATELIEITESDVPGLVGQQGRPSPMTMAVIEAVSPGITPNRNGWLSWRQTKNGRPISELRRHGGR